MTVVRRWVAAAVVVPLLAAGCSDDPEPRFGPSPSPSPTESNSEPAQPKAWEVKSEEGAHSFVQHWVATLNAAGARGDTQSLDEMSSADCSSCKNIIDYIAEVYDEGGQIDSKGWRLLQMAEISDRFARQAPVVSARVRQAAQSVHRTQPEKRLRVPPDTVSMSFHLEWRKSWVMTDVVVIE